MVIQDGPSNKEHLRTPSKAWKTVATPILSNLGHRQAIFVKGFVLRLTLSTFFLVIRFFRAVLKKKREPFCVLILVISYLWLVSMPLAVFTDVLNDSVDSGFPFKCIDSMIWNKR